MSSSVRNFGLFGFLTKFNSRWLVSEISQIILREEFSPFPVKTEKTDLDVLSLAECQVWEQYCECFTFKKVQSEHTSLCMLEISSWDINLQKSWFSSAAPRFTCQCCDHFLFLAKKGLGCRNATSNKAKFVMRRPGCQRLSRILFCNYPRHWQTRDNKSVFIIVKLLVAALFMLYRQMLKHSAFPDFPRCPAAAEDGSNSELQWPFGSTVV